MPVPDNELISAEPHGRAMDPYRALPSSPHATASRLPFVRGAAFRAPAMTPGDRRALEVAARDMPGSPAFRFDAAEGDEGYNSETGVRLSPSAGRPVALHETAHTSMKPWLPAMEALRDGAAPSREQRWTPAMETLAMVPETVAPGTARAGADRYWTYRHMLKHGPAGLENIRGPRDLAAAAKSTAAWAKTAMTPGTPLNRALAAYIRTGGPQFDTAGMVRHLRGRGMVPDPAQREAFLASQPAFGRDQAAADWDDAWNPSADGGTATERGLRGLGEAAARDPGLRARLQGIRERLFQQVEDPDPVPSPGDGGKGDALLRRKNAAESVEQRFHDGRSGRGALLQALLRKASAERLPEGTLLITGVPGSGKTTLAHALERRHGLPVVHLDLLKPNKGNRYPGTDEALAYLKTMKDPAIVEGTALLGLKPSMYRDTPIMLVELNRRELLRRLARRGLFRPSDPAMQGSTDPAAIREETDKMRAVKEEFKRRFHARGRVLKRKPPKDLGRTETKA